MNAIVLEEFGGPEKLLYKTDVADPEPGDSDVLIATSAASVNPIDWKVRSGDPRVIAQGVSLPTILGRDVSGVVRAVGSAVTGVAVGDRVMALTHSTYATLVMVPASDITHIPDGLDTVDAAALPLVVATGDQLIRKACALQQGQTVLITGATGSVGRAAVHSAKRLGCSVIAGVRAKYLDEAKALGVTGVVALDHADAVNNLGRFDSVADTVGGETAARLLSHVRPGGTFGSLLGPVQGAELHPDVTVNAMRAQPDPVRLKLFAEDVRDGKFELPIAGRYDLREAAKAQKIAEDGAGGKVLLMAL